MTQDLVAVLFGAPFAVMNTIGLVAFALVGSSKAIRERFDLFGIGRRRTGDGVRRRRDAGSLRGSSPVGTAVADILLDRSPFILLENFYASCAVLGGSAYWLVGTLGAAGGTAAAACAGVTLVTRLVAVTYDWSLPTAQRLESLGK